MIGDATDNRSQKRLTDMAKANACSRVIPFKQFVDNPNYITGALYIVKASERIETMTETRIVGVKVGDINFDFNKADVQSQYGADLDALGSFLKKTPMPMHCWSVIPTASVPRNTICIYPTAGRTVWLTIWSIASASAGTRSL